MFGSTIRSMSTSVESVTITASFNLDLRYVSSLSCQALSLNIKAKQSG